MDIKAEAAASAGERAVRGFMVAVYRATTNATSVQQVRSHHLGVKDGTHPVFASGRLCPYSCTKCVQKRIHMFASIWQYLTSISRLLLPLDGTHAACCEQMALSMANSERAALKGLQLCIDTIMAEVSMQFSFPILYH